MTIRIAGHRARRVAATAKPGFLDRIGLRDAEVGDSLILVNHTHQDADTPYHASYAVFVSEASDTAYIHAHSAAPGCYGARIERA